MGQTAVLPVVEEVPVVHKRRVDTGIVRVRRRTTKREETLNVPLEVQTVHVERVPVDRIVDAVEQPRVEGDTTIVPVCEEVLVVERRFRVVEEIRLTKRVEQRQATQVVTLRRHEVDIDRLPAPQPPEVPVVPVRRATKRAR